MHVPAGGAENRMRSELDTEIQIAGAPTCAGLPLAGETNLLTFLHPGRNFHLERSRAGTPGVALYAEGTFPAAKGLFERDGDLRVLVAAASG